MYGLHLYALFINVLLHGFDHARAGIQPQRHAADQQGAARQHQIARPSRMSLARWFLLGGQQVDTQSTALFITSIDAMQHQTLCRAGFEQRLQALAQDCHQQHLRQRTLFAGYPCNVLQLIAGVGRVFVEFEADYCVHVAQGRGGQQQRLSEQLVGRKQQNQTLVVVLLASPGQRPVDQPFMGLLEHTRAHGGGQQGA